VDDPGVVGQGANIVDLSSRLVGDPPIYVLGIEVEHAEGALDELRRALARTAASLGVEMSLEPEGDEVL